MKIYAITNNLSGKQYVGSTTLSLERRLYHHCHTQTMPIGREIAVVGAEHFSITLLAETEDEYDRDLEPYWIDKLNTLAPNGYNMNRPGTAEVRKASYVIRLTTSQIAELEARIVEAGYEGRRNAYFIKLLSL